MKQECIPTHSISGGPPSGVHAIHKVQYMVGVQQYLYQAQRWVESRLSNPGGIIQTHSDVLWPH